MDQKIWILIYSKFSNASKNIFKLIDSITLPFKLTPVCIDNVKNRKAIQQSETFKIDRVPCIICVDKISGVADQYEGENAFELVKHFYVDDSTTNISDLTDEPITEEPVQGEYRIKQKLSVSEIVKQAERPPSPLKREEPQFKQVKTGSPVDIASIMALASRNNNE